MVHSLPSSSEKAPNCSNQETLKHNMDKRQKRKEKKHKKGICDITSKGLFSYILEGLKPLPALVSSHWSGQRGEFSVLHHSDGCVQSYYARAAGSLGCRGRSSDGLTPLVQGLRPRFTGQGLVRTQAWLLANGSSRSVAGSRTGQANDL